MRASHHYNPIVFHLNIPNQQANAIIRDITLCGYDEGSFNIFLQAVNDITTIVLNKKLDELTSPLLIKREKMLPSQINISIRSESDLKAFTLLLESIEHMPDTTYCDIKNAYDAFINKKKLAVRKSSKTKQSNLPNVYAEVLYQAIEKYDFIKVQTLLRLGVNPNSPPKYGQSPLLCAIWEYIPQKNIRYRPELFKIIKELLDYGADVNFKHVHFQNTALSTAADYGLTELVNLLLKYERKVEFALCSKEDAPHSSTIVKLDEQFKRISFFAQQAKKGDNIKTEVSLLPAEMNSGMLVSTEFKRGTDFIQVESFLTTKLPADYLDRLFELYKDNFKSKSESTPDLQQKHFKEKLGLLDSDSQVYIDIVKTKDNIIGFNLYKIYHGEFAQKPYYVVYCSLAYIDKMYRGTRVMSLLSFRGPFALKEAHPNVETYIFYDAIHPNSYRQVWDLLPRYPECRTEESVNFIKHIAKQIYGEDRARQFDGKNNFFWPTDARVESNPIKLNEYDLPCVIEKFDEITQGKEGVPGKGGVPVVLPVILSHFKQLAENINAKLNNTIFEAHVEQFAKRVFFSNEKKIWENDTECLWPNNHVLKNRY